MRNEIDLTDEAIEAIFDETPYGVTIDDVVFTRETLEDYRDARKNYNESGHLSDEVFGGFPAIMIERAQPFRGDRRKDVVVVDFGTVRGSVAL